MPPIGKNNSQLYQGRLFIILRIFFILRSDYNIGNNQDFSIVLKKTVYLSEISCYFLNEIQSKAHRQEVGKTAEVGVSWYGCHCVSSGRGYHLGRSTGLVIESIPPNPDIQCKSLCSRYMASLGLILRIQTWMSNPGRGL